MTATDTSPITSGSSMCVMTTDPMSASTREPRPRAIAQPAPRAAVACIDPIDSVVFCAVTRGAVSALRSPLRTASSRTNAKQHDLDRVEHDGEVEEHRVALDVIEVVLQLFEHVLRRRAVLAAYLRVTGETRLHVEPLLEVRHLLLELLYEHGALGARTDHAHVAAEHVPKLRQLVDSRLSDEF